MVGDPYHKHPLIEASNIPENGDGGVANCFHCELPITELISCYGCPDCNYYIHKWCQNLPITLLHPLHDQHSLTRFEPPTSSNSPNLCSQCQKPCLGRFAYHCPTCLLFFHLSCLSTLNHKKHDHTLFLSQSYRVWSCKVCGFPSRGFYFGCIICEFFIHLECSLFPETVEHHHIHELTLRHNFPQECEQVYCDRCEDKDGELDPSLSYYYCTKCDYIAHVHCCITQSTNELYRIFTHEHPLTKVENTLSCTQCDYILNLQNGQYPSLIKHPSHREHTLVVEYEGDGVFNCTECQFTVNINEVVKFTHPLFRNDLKFYCDNKVFRCHACGELGEGYRVGNILFFEGEFDLHLECFALPGKLKHESHPHHPLYLRWLYDVLTSRYCSVCNKEIDPQLWFYFCRDCDYAAHMDCVAHYLLLNVRSSIKNQHDFFATIELEKTLFIYQDADI